MYQFYVFCNANRLCCGYYPTIVTFIHFWLHIPMILRSNYNQEFVSYHRIELDRIRRNETALTITSKQNSWYDNRSRPLANCGVGPYETIERVLHQPQIWFGRTQFSRCRSSRRLCVKSDMSLNDWWWQHQHFGIKRHNRTNCELCHRVSDRPDALNYEDQVTFDTCAKQIYVWIQTLAVDQSNDRITNYKYIQLYFVFNMGFDLSVNRPTVIPLKMAQQSRIQWECRVRDRSLSRERDDFGQNQNVVASGTTRRYFWYSFRRTVFHS